MLGQPEYIGRNHSAKKGNPYVQTDFSTGICSNFSCPFHDLFNSKCTTGPNLRYIHYGGTMDNSRPSNARGIMHIHQTETYYIASGSGTLVTGGEIYNGNGVADYSNVTTTLNGPSCSGLIVGDWISKHVKEGA